MSAITAKASRKMKKYAVLTREPRCFLGSFDFSWEQRKLGELVDRVVRKNTNNESTLPLTISAQYGLVDQITYFNNRVASRDVSNYYLVLNGEFAYNKSTSDGYPFGAVKRLDLYEKGVLSTLYIVFAPKKEQQIDSDYLTVFFDTDRWHKGVAERAAEGARNHGLLNISAEDFFDIDLSVPKDIVEQKQIGAFIRQLDNLITLHQRKYAFLFRRFRAAISKKLATSTFSWEQRKFGEVFDCTVPNNTLSRAELSYDEGTVLNVHYGDVLIKYGSVLDVQKDDIPRIPHRCREDFNGALLQDGDIIIADTAEDETTGKACEISNLQGSVIVSGLHTMVCRPRNRMALGYLGYYLNSNAYHHQLLPLMQGIKVLSLSRSNIQKTSVSYPTAVKEQQHIAYYFSQLDNLITLHQRERISFSGRASRLIPPINKKRITSSWEQRKVREVTDRYDNLRIPVAASLRVAGTTPYYGANGIQDYVDGYTHDGEFILVAEDGANDLKNYPVKCVKGRIWVNNHAHVLQGKYDCADNQFLAYAISQADIESLLVGGGRAKLNAETLMGIDLLLPNKAEQIRIGKYLAQLDNLITLHQRKPFLMKWRTSDANRNQTNRLVL